MAFNNFPYTNAHELNLDWVIKKQKDTSNEVAVLDGKVTEFENYFDNLDVQDEIDNKLDEMAEDGSLGQAVYGYIKNNKDVVILTASFGDPDYLGYANVFTLKCKNRIELQTGIKVYTGYRRSAGFADDNPYNATYQESLDMAYATIPDPNTIGQVIIVGGGNDVGHTRYSISVGMAEFMAYAKTKFPNAIFRFAWCSWRLNAASSIYENYNDCIAIMKDLCPKNGIGYCENSEYIFHVYDPDWYLSDGIHPTETGSDHLADGIVQCIMTGSCDVTREEVFIANPSGTEDPSYFLTRPSGNTYPFLHMSDFTIRQHNGTTTIIPGSTLASPSIKLSTAAVSYNNNPDNPKSENMGTLNSKLLKLNFKQHRYGSFNIRVCMYSSTVRNQIPATGRYYNGVLYISLVIDSNYQSVGNDQSFAAWLPEITLPTAYC